MADGYSLRQAGVAAAVGGRRRVHPRALGGDAAALKTAMHYLLTDGLARRRLGAPGSRDGPATWCTVAGTRQRQLQ